MPDSDQQSKYFAVLLIFLAVTQVTKLPPGLTFRSALLTPDTLPFAFLSFSEQTVHSVTHQFEMRLCLFSSWDRVFLSYVSNPKEISI